MAAEVTIRGVHDLEQEVGLDGLGERAVERGHEVVGQLADEPHRVGEQHHLALGAHHLAGGGVERGEQAVFDEHAGPGERVEQRALARVRVAHERDAELATPLAALGLTLALDGAEIAPQHRDALAHAAAVHLELGLARAARADAARLTLEVLPHAGEPRQSVLELRQLDLEPRLAGSGAAREDVEDQLRAIHHLHRQLLLQVADLGSGEIVVEDHEVGIAIAGQFGQLLELALADERGGMDRAAALHQRAEHPRAGGVGQERQLLERAREAAPVAAGVSHQQRALGTRRVHDLVRALQPSGSISSSYDAGVRFSNRPSGCARTRSSIRTPRPREG